MESSGTFILNGPAHPPSDGYRSLRPRDSYLESNGFQEVLRRCGAEIRPICQICEEAWTLNDTMTTQDGWQARLSMGS